MATPPTETVTESERCQGHLRLLPWCTERAWQQGTEGPNATLKVYGLPVIPNKRMGIRHATGVVRRLHLRQTK